tara:strand:- start:1447 stop:2079 length:633 start_codon:yes stop_codon:yes gene_type:complete
MPNWCDNRIRGYTDDVKEKDFFRNIIEDLTETRTDSEGNEVSGIDLGILNPTPEILTKVHASSPPYLVKDRETGEFVKQSIGSPELGDSKEERNAFYDTNTHPKFEKVEIVEGTDIYKELMDRYGHLSWYEWNVDNWGTKWNPTTELSNVYVDEYGFEINVSSAWCPPEVLLQRLATKYDVSIENFYEIEGYGDEGVGKEYYEPNYLEEE